MRYENHTQDIMKYNKITYYNTIYMSKYVVLHGMVLLAYTIIYHYSVLNIDFMIVLENHSWTFIMGWRRGRDYVLHRLSARPHVSSYVMSAANLRHSRADHSETIEIHRESNGPCVP